MKRIFPLLFATLLVGGIGATLTPFAASSAAAQSTGTKPTDTKAAAAQSSNSKPKTPAVTAEAPAGIPLPFARDKVELRDGAGQVKWVFQPSPPQSVKLLDAAGKEVARFLLSDGRLKAKSPEGRELFELKKKDDKLTLKDADGEKELLKFKRKGQEVDVYSPTDQRLYRVRKKDYGFALEDNHDKTLVRAKLKDGKVALRDLEDKTMLDCRGVREPLGLVFLAIPEMTAPQQAACFLFFHP